MPVPSLITDLTPVAATNSPAGSESPGTADDYFRAHAAFIAQLRAVIGGAADANIPSSWAVGTSQYAKNKLINGNFQVNQRAVSGTVVLAAGVYGHDRFKAGASGCTYTFASSGGVTTITIISGSLVQVVEDVNLITGNHALSWAGTAQGKIGASSYSESGVSALVTGGANLSIEFNAGTLSRVQLEVGSIATPFEHRPYGQELALCQRYYAIVDTRLAGYTAASAANQYTIQLCTQMRAAPTITVGATTNINTTGATVVSQGVGHVLHSSMGAAAGGFISAAIATLSAEL